jgi:hypothetical protein
MSEYYPDKWLMVKLTNKAKKSHYRIFACWYGGFAGSDSWQLNSGVTKITEDEHGYHFEGSSGSVYHCNRNTYGTNGYGRSVLTNMIEKSKDEILIEIIDEDTNFMELSYE